MSVRLSDVRILSEGFFKLYVIHNLKILNGDIDFSLTLNP